MEDLMKITHNKVGQNINLVDGLKQEKTDITRGLKDSLDKSSKANALDASRVEVSEQAQQAKKIKEIAMSVPDIDAEKVARFRKMIDDGTYKVDARAVADRMVDEHLET
jgi:negative regulator of flagellin synthesis FlgM